MGGGAGLKDMVGGGGAVKTSCTEIFNPGTGPPVRVAESQGLGALGVILEAFSWTKVAKALVVVSGLVPCYPGYNREGNSQKAWRGGLSKSADNLNEILKD